MSGPDGKIHAWDGQAPPRTGGDIAIQVDLASMRADGLEVYLHLDGTYYTYGSTLPRIVFPKDFQVVRDSRTGQDMGLENQGQGEQMEGPR